MRGTPLDAVLYAVSSEEEMELLRWILSIKPELPVIVLIPRTEERLRKEILAEGVAQVLVVTSFKPREIRKSILGSGLRALGSRKVPSDVRQQISDELHAIRSTLTAILGTAEMALKRSQPAARTRKHIKEIPQEVMEIEKILRRIHRTIKTTSPTQR